MFRSRSQDDSRKSKRSVNTEEDVDQISLNVTGASSSVYAVTAPDSSINTSYDERTLSDIHCPPHMPLLHTAEHCSALLQDTAVSPVTRDREQETYY